MPVSSRATSCASASKRRMNSRLVGERRPDDLDGAPPVEAGST
jgi:hypothetical protein